MTEVNILQTMKKTRLSWSQEWSSEGILRNGRWLNVTNAAKRLRKYEVLKLDWPLGLVVMRSSETSLKVNSSPATRAQTGRDEVEKGVW